MINRALESVVALLVVASECVAQESRPSISYGSTRESKSWIETPHGNVAVDEGVAFQGVKVYLSLTWDLVATDEKTGKVLWSANVGAFWNEIGFAEVETSPGVKTWAVELRPGPRSRQGSELQQHHDLKTGKVIAKPAETPSGTQLDLSRQWTGRWCASEKAIRRIVAGDVDWKASVLDVLFPDGKNAPDFGPIDFEKNIVLVIAMGEISNCSGMDATAWEDDLRVLVRLREHWFQTEGPDGGAQKVRPFGIFVLPRRDPFKPVIVERNRQHLIGGPAIWKEAFRFTAPGDAPAESRPARQRAR
jgi:hypothetical protein